MKAPARLGLYGLVLVAVFAAAAITANAVVPESTVQAWAENTESTTHQGQEGGDNMDSTGHEVRDAGAGSLGLGIAQDGYQLTAVTAPDALGANGELS